MVTNNTKNHKRMRIRQTHTQTHTNHSRGALLDNEKGTKFRIATYNQRF